jgi:GT2 family glycosyltransferase
LTGHYLRARGLIILEVDFVDRDAHIVHAADHRLRRSPKGTAEHRLRRERVPQLKRSKRGTRVD